MTSHRGLLSLVACLALCLPAGCSDSGSESASLPPPSAQAPARGPADGSSDASEGLVYAALGDSFSAAPYVPNTSLAGGCLRSDGNYPSLVATELKPARFTDVTCSAAATADIAKPQTTANGQGTVAPQLDAVSTRTELVTLGMGGNDEGLFASLVFICSTLRAEAGSPCFDTFDQGNPTAEEKVKIVGRRMQRVLRAITAKAPQAQIIVVGYPTLLDPSQPCSLIDLAPGDLRRAAALERSLNDVLSSAAAAEGADFLDVKALSREHAICAADPWVNGPTTDESAALAYHPFAVEQQAVAEALLELIEKP